MVGIYQIRNKVNGKQYIGQSVNVVKRWREEAKGQGVNDHLRRAFAKYGLENFSFSVLCECAPTELDELETLVISETESYKPLKGYNKTFGGDGVRATTETKKKISDAHKGKVLTEEHKRKLSERKRGANHPYYGKKRPASVGQKVSASKMGKKHPMSEQTRLKQIEYRRTHLMYNVRKVVQKTKHGEVVQVHQSIAEAGRAMQVFHTSIMICAQKRTRGVNATSCGFIWEYVD